MTRPTYPATVEEARTLLQGVGARVLTGSADMIRDAALAECEAEARRQGWVGAWEPVPADSEYVQAQLILGGAAHAEGLCLCEDRPCLRGHVGAEGGHCECGTMTKVEYEAS